MRPKSLNYPPNPNYGLSACRRRISTQVDHGHVRAHLSDNFHEMRCAVFHAAGMITDIAAETIRIPTSVCPGAIEQIRRLVGRPIDTPASEFYGNGRAARHCTHLLDLTVIAIRHCREKFGSTLYEATVPDETSDSVEIDIRRNGEIVHKWRIRDGHIQEPEPLKGKTLDRGFAAWAREAYDGDNFEAATILSRTWLIAVGRRYLNAEAAGQPASINPEMFDRCFAYSLPQRAQAVFTGEIERDPPF
jgi:hypothetical protein